MMFNNPKDDIYQPIFDLFKKVKIIATTILVGLNNFFIHIDRTNLLTIY